ncbi:hypothetical protein BCR34DRAFT_605071 [Clohesyomyces aquaticus]|uniref:SWR1-complex protein 4 n=1 Tax=Clohesyomyces aquaticus TaxID=1231657 RepID=A0A1Y1Z100_9PLEO|nr:hypothetical protein BCR34DRAFT_605071 [Clohesyomyces aquaticus]
MASGRDVRDMLGLPADADIPKTAIQKRPKPAAPGKKIQGVAREVAALYGERPPPVAVYEEKKTYRAKRQSTGPAKKWIQQPFLNPARNDGLVLKHWKRKPTAAQPALTNGEDAAMEDVENAPPAIETNYDFAKFNIPIDGPIFTDEEYDAHLRTNDWSREETDYLLDMVKEYYYRWAVIWDRYEYTPSTKQEPPSQENFHGDPNHALASLPFAPPKSRSVEDLKARFYEISAKLMKLRIPEVQMDAEQYARYEILTKFDPHLERNRKNLAAALMNRSMDEVKEEEFLLTELQRINMAATRLDAEREELRSRLEAPIPNQQIAAGLASFQSSQALASLFQQLFQQDRSKKRASGSASGPGRLSLSGADIIGTPTSAAAHQHSGGQMSSHANASRRQSMATNAQPPTPIRQLSPQTEHRFNVSTHDRLTSGVSFGADKLLKMRQAKSNVQTQKIATALAELGVPEVIPIPTSKVGEVFESLISKVGKLLDVRKVREKEEGECRILEAMKERRASENQGGEGEAGHSREGHGERGGDGDVNMGDGGSTTPATTAQREVQDSEERDGDDDDDDDDADMDADADGDEDDVDADGEADDNGDVDAEGEEDDDEDAEGEEFDSRAPSQSQSARHTSEAVSARAVSQGHKRSASVFSQTSNKSTKRARK